MKLFRAVFILCISLVVGGPGEDAAAGVEEAKYRNDFIVSNNKLFHWIQSIDRFYDRATMIASMGNVARTKRSELRDKIGKFYKIVKDEVGKDEQKELDDDFYV